VTTVYVENHFNNSNGKTTVTIREKGACPSMNTANYEMIHYVLSLDRHCIKIADESIQI
jgi:hypothetical protein